MRCRHCGKVRPNREAVCPHCRRFVWSATLSPALLTVLFLAVAGLAVAGGCYFLAHGVRSEQHRAPYILLMWAGLVWAGLFLAIDLLIFVELLADKYKSPAKSAGRCLKVGAQIQRQGGYSAAEDYYSAVIEMADAPPDDRIAALVARAIGTANSGVEWQARGVPDSTSQPYFKRAIVDLENAATIDGRSVAWKWKTFFNIGRLKLRLLDFAGASDALSRALEISESFDSHDRAILAGTAAVEGKNNALLFLARARAGVGDRVGAKEELLKLLREDSITENIRAEAERDLQALS